MRIERDFETEKSIIDVATLSVGGKRAGWHVTDLTRCLRKTFFERMGVEGVIEEGRVLRMKLGKMSEDLTDLFEAKQIQGEKDGIIGTVDGLLEDRIVEKKFTYLSSNKNIKEQVYWIEQVKAYCYIFGKNTVQFRIIHLLGNYKRPFKPEIRVWNVYFTDDEIKDFWNEILFRKKYVEMCLLEKVLPEQSKFDWECKNCEYKEICMGGEIFEDFSL